MDLALLVGELSWPAQGLLGRLGEAWEAGSGWHEGLQQTGCSVSLASHHTRWPRPSPRWDGNGRGVGGGSDSRTCREPHGQCQLGRGHHAAEGRTGGYSPSFAVADSPSKWPLGSPRPPPPAGTGLPPPQATVPRGGDAFTSSEAVPTPPWPERTHRALGDTGAGPALGPRAGEARARDLSVPCPQGTGGAPEALRGRRGGPARS